MGIVQAEVHELCQIVELTMWGMVRHVFEQWLDLWKGKVWQLEEWYQEVLLKRYGESGWELSLKPAKEGKGVVWVLASLWEPLWWFLIRDGQLVKDRMELELEKVSGIQLQLQTLHNNFGNTLPNALPSSYSLAISPHQLCQYRLRWYGCSPINIEFALGPAPKNKQSSVGPDYGLFNSSSISNTALYFY